MKTLIVALTLSLLLTASSYSHPLGIFSNNRYSQIEIAGHSLRVHYVVDVAEIPAMAEFRLIDRDGDGDASGSERRAYAEAKSSKLLKKLSVTLDEGNVPLQLVRSEVTFPEGQGGLKTVRLESTYEYLLNGAAAQRLRFHDGNFADRQGWKEIITTASAGATIQESSVPMRDITDALRHYPEELIQSPVSISDAALLFTPGTGSSTVAQLADAAVNKAKDSFAALVSTRELSPAVILLSLGLAMVLGAGHALTPGHGKTIVAAYLVGSRGTAKHAAFLGFTVTATHTIGVFAMGLIALFASHYVLPETLYPWLSMISGLMVVGIGLSLIRKRVLHAMAKPDTALANPHEHYHADGHAHPHDGFLHTRDGHTHTHLPPGSDGSPITWRSLLTLGVSGGLVPCPSAIVVLLSAVALGRIGFGLLLILSFSIGLAGVLSGIGFLMVYARRYFERFNTQGAVMRWLPVLSSIAVTIAGTIIAAQAVGQTNVAGMIASLFSDEAAGAHSLQNAMQFGAVSILSLGFVLGLKHALDADHLVAVSTIVSERKGFLSSSIVGALWGLGHTASLFIVGLGVIALNIRIPERVAMTMEFCVALMLVALGINVLRKLSRAATVHMHAHNHDGHMHFHPHAHHQDHGTLHQHHLLPKFIENIWAHIRDGKRSILVGMVHGMAGSAALMLIVLATIPSRALALAYIGIFGLGSVGGMFVMSTLVGVPFVFTVGRSAALNRAVRGLAGTVSILFGLFLVWQIGFVDGLLMQ